MKTMQEKQKSVFEALKKEFKYDNVMQAPKVTKVIVSSGVGKISDKHKRALIEDRLAKITGQKAAPRAAKQSIASFKLRQGETVGYQVTLRGARMNAFLDRLIHLTLPQTRDFHGLKTDSIDDMGNYSLGIKEHTVFPETADEDIKDVFGLSITIVTSAKTKEEAEALLRHIGLPLQKKK